MGEDEVTEDDDTIRSWMFRSKNSKDEITGNDNSISRMFRSKSKKGEGIDDAGESVPATKIQEPTSTESTANSRPWMLRSINKSILDAGDSASATKIQET